MIKDLLGTAPWFAPKWYGYGAGLPIAWQGWALLAGYIVVGAGLGLLIDLGHVIPGVAGLIVTLPLFIWLVKRHTRGGWRWRWGWKSG